ncbi:MAG: glycosyltransferase, partial [Thermoguttaceae bacterium]
MPHSPLSIVHLISGAGGMYCGSCLHGNALAAALLEARHDVILVPLYTPVRTDDHSVPQHNLAFGGLNVFLQQKFSVFRNATPFLDRWLDRPGLVRWMTRWSGGTDAAGLGALTVSMLQGPSGRQRKELDKLLQLLAAIPRIDVVHLSNVLLAGLAGPIRAALGVPVVVSLTGEDIFIDQLPEPYSGQVQAELRRCAASVDALVATNRYFAHRMAGYLGVPPAVIHVIPPGINLDGHAAAGETAFPASPATAPGLFRVGYFSRICPDKGLHLLADAAEIIDRQDPSCPIAFDAAGYLGPRDRPYLRQVER